MRNRSIAYPQLLCSLVVAFTVLGSSTLGSVEAQTASFDVVDLGWPGEALEAELVDIADDGNVLLNATFDGSESAFLHDGDAFSEVESGGGDFVATAIDRSGQIAGWIVERGDGTEDPSPMAALIVGDSVVEMPGDTSQSLSLGVSPEGVVVGQASEESDPQALRPVTWSDTDVDFLADVDGDTTGAALDMNSIGQVVGWTGELATGTMAMRWDDGAPVRLEVDGEPFSFAVAINATGSAVGGASNDSSMRGSDTRAIQWDASGATMLPVVEGISWAFATDINDAGIVVGVAGVEQPGEGDPETVAVTWSAGEMFDLNSMIGSETGLTLVEAVAVNSFGQILCLGIDSSGEAHALVLSVIGN